MSFIAMTDFEDELLVKLMSQSDIDAGNEAIEQLAFSLGIEADQIKTTPLNSRVKKYGVAAAYEHRAKLKMGVNPKQFQGSDGEDAYGQKRRIYAREMEKLESTITVAMLTGGQKEADNFFCMTLGRG